MMRAYTVRNCNKSSDSEIIQWVNSTLQGAHKASKISGFNDPTLTNSIAVIDLVDAIRPNVVDYKNVSHDDTAEAKLLNAKYALSVAKKIGATTYAFPEDLVEVKPTIVMTTFASLMTREGK